MEKIEAIGIIKTKHGPGRVDYYLNISPYTQREGHDKEGFAIFGRVILESIFKIILYITYIWKGITYFEMSNNIQRRTR